MEIEQLNIPVHGFIGWTVKNFLSKEECDEIIQNQEKNTYLIDDKKYRYMYHNSFFDNKLSELCFSRIKNIVPSKISVTSEDYIFYSHVPELVVGEWELKDLNNCWRIAKYAEIGAHFGPHTDSHYEADYNHRSFYTFMIYLTNSSGTTNFLKEVTDFKNKEGKIKSPEENILFRLRPETGMLLIFKHFIPHEGGSVNEEKWILRSDIMYTSNIKLNETQLRVYYLCKEADNLVDEGKNEEAVLLYRQVNKLWHNYI